MWGKSTYENNVLSIHKYRGYSAPQRRQSDAKIICIITQRPFMHWLTTTIYANAPSGNTTRLYGNEIEIV